MSRTLVNHTRATGQLWGRLARSNASGTSSGVGCRNPKRNRMPPAPPRNRRHRRNRRHQRMRRNASAVTGATDATGASAATTCAAAGATATSWRATELEELREALKQHLRERMRIRRKTANVEEQPEPLGLAGSGVGLPWGGAFPRGCSGRMSRTKHRDHQSCRVPQPKPSTKRTNANPWNPSRGRGRRGQGHGPNTQCSPLRPRP